jgi:hypothetical protein
MINGVDQIITRNWLAIGYTIAKAKISGVSDAVDCPKEPLQEKWFFRSHSAFQYRWSGWNKASPRIENIRLNTGKDQFSWLSLCHNSVNIRIYYR